MILLTLIFILISCGTLEPATNAAKDEAGNSVEDTDNTNLNNTFEGVVKVVDGKVYFMVWEPQILIKYEITGSFVTTIAVFDGIILKVEGNITRIDTLNGIVDVTNIIELIGVANKRIAFNKEMPIAKQVKIVNGVVYLVVDWESKSRKSFKVIGRLMQKVAIFEGRALLVNGKIEYTSPWSGTIEVTEIISVEGRLY